MGEMNRKPLWIRAGWAIILIGCASLCILSGFLMYQQLQQSQINESEGRISAQLDQSTAQLTIWLQMIDGLSNLVAESPSEVDISQRMGEWKKLIPSLKDVTLIDGVDQRVEEVQQALSKEPDRIWMTASNRLTLAQVLPSFGEDARRKVMMIDFDLSTLTVELFGPANGQIEWVIEAPDSRSTRMDDIRRLDDDRLLIAYRKIDSSVVDAKEAIPLEVAGIYAAGIVFMMVGSLVAIGLEVRNRRKDRIRLVELEQEHQQLLHQLSRSSEQPPTGQVAPFEEQMAERSQVLDNNVATGLFESDQTAIQVKSILPVIGDEEEDPAIPHGEGELVFIVEDDPLAARVTSRHLQKHGYRTETFATGELFMQAFVNAKEQPHAILLDVMLPDHNGFYLAANVRERFSPLELPIIFLSGRSELMDVIRGFDQGANDYLIKPVAKNELMMRIRIQIRLAQWGAEMKEAVIQRSGSMKALMDHSEQGFISIDSNFIVSDEHSHACEAIFNRKIRGVPLAELLEPDQPAEAELLNQILTKLFSEPHSPSREIMIGLLPVQVARHERSLMIHYKILDGEDRLPDRLLVFITDQTESERLKKRIAQEQHQLKMVIKVVSKRRDFVELLQHYFDFCDSWSDEMSVDDQTSSFLLGDMLRQVHTFKGNFAQYEMNALVAKLHEFEQVLKDLANQGPIDPEILHHLMQVHRLRAYVQSDLDVIIRTLGPGFLERSDDVSIRRALLKQMEARAMNELPEDHRDSFAIAIRCLYYQPLKELLEPYTSYVQQLSQRLDKSVVPFHIDGDYTLADPSVIEPLVQVMVHIFRNSVDHGIENYEDRIEFGKDGNARIVCTVKEHQDGVLIEVKDDGRGVNANRIKRRALELGIINEQQAAGWTEGQYLDLIFHEQFTTKRQVTDVSGRGIGLSAVRQVVQQFNGDISVRSVSGEGTTVSIRLPWGAMLVRQPDALLMY